MIPYEDLVAALSSWRARQGLAGTAAPARSPAAAPAPSRPAPQAQPPAAAPRSQPPAPAPARSGPPAAPPRTAAPARAALDDYDDGMVENTAYDPAGDDDYILPLGDAPDHTGESTAIGPPPEPPKRKRDW